MTARRKMLLTGYPVPASDVRGIFGGPRSPVNELLEHPPVLRRSGWDLETGDQAHIVEGQLLQVANGNRKVIQLYRDGALIFACRADDWFLAWATPPGKQRINPLALAEVIYSFCSLYRHIVEHLAVEPAEIKFRVDFQAMRENGPPGSLAPHALGTFAQELDLDTKEAPANEATLKTSVPLRAYDPAVVAYKLVREVYLWFGFAEQAIPYVSAGEDPSLDTRAISAIGK